MLTCPESHQREVSECGNILCGSWSDTCSVFGASGFAGSVFGEFASCARRADEYNTTTPVSRNQRPTRSHTACPQPKIIGPFTTSRIRFRSLVDYAAPPVPLPHTHLARDSPPRRLNAGEN